MASETIAYSRNDIRDILKAFKVMDAQTVSFTFKVSKGAVVETFS